MGGLQDSMGERERVEVGPLGRGRKEREGGGGKGGEEGGGRETPSSRGRKSSSPGLRTTLRQHFYVFESLDECCMAALRA